MAFLMATTGGEIEKGPPVRRAIAEAPDPDAAIGAMMREMTRLAEEQAALPTARVS